MKPTKTRKPAVPPTCNLQLSYAVPRRGVPAPSSFSSWANLALVNAKVSGLPQQVGLSLRIVDAAEALELNTRYRNKAFPTNVLSFPAELPRGVPREWLGDLVMCAPVLAQEASEQQKPLRAHYAHMTMHGMLHLLGYEHEIEEDAQAMEALETQLLAGLGFPDPYAPR